MDVQYFYVQYNTEGTNPGSCQESTVTRRHRSKQSYYLIIQRIWWQDKTKQKKVYNKQTGKEN